MMERKKERMRQRGYSNVSKTSQAGFVVVVAQAGFVVVVDDDGDVIMTPFQAFCDDVAQSTMQSYCSGPEANGISTRVNILEPSQKNLIMIPFYFQLFMINMSQCFQILLNVISSVCLPHEA